MMQSIGWQYCPKVFLFLSAAPLRGGDYSSSLAVNCPRKCPSFKKTQTCKKPHSTLRRACGSVSHGEQPGMNSWFQGRDPEAELPQSWIFIEHSGALYTQMFREVSPLGIAHCTLCARIESARLEVKWLPSVIIFPLGKIGLHLGSASDWVPMITSRWKSYQCSFLFILHCQVWLLLLSVRLEPKLLFVLSNGIEALAFRLCEILHLMKRKTRGVISIKTSRRQELVLPSFENSCFQENYSPNGGWGHWPLWTELQRNFVTSRGLSCLSLMLPSAAQHIGLQDCGSAEEGCEWLWGLLQFSQLP